MRTLIAVVLVGACGAPAPKATRPAPRMHDDPLEQEPAGPFTLPPGWAPLFEPDQRWTFGVARYEEDPLAEGELDDIRPPTWQGETTCRVAAAIHFEGGVASEITCDELPEEAGRPPAAIAGVYLADARGLYRTGGPLPADGIAPPHRASQRLFGPDETCWARPLLDGNADQLCVEHGRISFARVFWTDGGTSSLSFFVPTSGD